ncbi:hypothetical protein [Natrinema saccharevitans]|uniref:hypothetical protein n=1 Tax=Natrinema saccharevitans TaxID=301967 RepID=UPI00158A0EDE|nr:hypothetical protein [Natrinema saccharevitans]
MSDRSFSVPELRERIGPDASEATVRERLAELRDRGVVAAETYPSSTTLYYVDFPDGTGRPAATDSRPSANPLDRLSAREFLLLRDSEGIRTIVLAGYQLSLVCFVLGLALSVGGLEAPFRGGHGLWTAGWNLLAVCVALRIAELAATRIRERRGRT